MILPSRWLVFWRGSRKGFGCTELSQRRYQEASQTNQRGQVHIDRSHDISKINIYLKLSNPVERLLKTFSPKPGPPAARTPAPVPSALPVTYKVRGKAHRSSYGRAM